MEQRQRIVWPWETKHWHDWRQKLTAPVTSIVDMDTRISSMYSGKLKPRQITDLFGRYERDEFPDRITTADFLQRVVPHMQSLLDSAPRTFRAVDSTVLAHCYNTILTRPQVATIVACMWFGLFDKYNYLSKGSAVDLDDLNEPTFVNMFANQNIFMLQCVVNYFHRVQRYMTDEDEDVRNAFAGGNVILRRHTARPYNWDRDVPLSEVCIGEGNIDDSPAKLHVAFAHEFVGGDMFAGALSHEEMTLVIRPECLAAVVFCAQLGDDTLTVFGAEKMSAYRGWGSSVTYDGNHTDRGPVGYSKDQREVMLQQAVVFMDASAKTAGLSQLVGTFQRDLNKAYCGFSSVTLRGECAVATGNWMYGHTGANMQVKFIQQLLAASAAGKALYYHSNSREFEDRIHAFVSWTVRERVTTRQLVSRYLRLIKKYNTGAGSRVKDIDVFDCLMNDY